MTDRLAYIAIACSVISMLISVTMICFVVVAMAVMTSQIQDVQGRIVGRGPRGWHKEDMVRLVQQWQANNPQLSPPEVRNSWDFEHE